MAKTTLKKTSAAPAARVPGVYKPPVVPVKQSGPGVRGGNLIPTAAGLIGQSGVPVTSQGGLFYALSDPFNQGTYREVSTGEVTTGANLGQEIQTAVEESVTALGGQFENFLIQRGGWIVALVVTVLLMVVAAQSFLRG